MTGSFEMVRVYRDSTNRFAVWCPNPGNPSDAWLELEAELVTVVDGVNGPMASILVPCVVKGRAPEPDMRAKVAPCGDVHPVVTLPEELQPEPRPIAKFKARAKVVKAAAPTNDVVEDPPAPVTTRPTWGGKDPKADAIPAQPEPLPAPPALTAPRVRFFTLTLANGTQITNYGTDFQGTDDEASDFVRQRWDLLTQGVALKKAVKVELQDGRVGTDRPDVEPPKPPPGGAGAGADGASGRATLFRFRGKTLQESMATAQPCTSIEELIDILRTRISGMDDGIEKAIDVRHHTFDERVGWDTYLVSIKGEIVGMTNGEL